MKRRSTLQIRGLTWTVTGESRASFHYMPLIMQVSFQRGRYVVTVMGEIIFADISAADCLTWATDYIMAHHAAQFTPMWEQVAS